MFCLGQKMPRIKFIGILENVSKNNLFLFKKEKQCLEHFECFQTWFHNAYHLLHYPQCLHSLFILFCSLISVSKKQNIEKVLTLPYSYNWQKFNKKMNEKKETRSIWVLRIWNFQGYQRNSMWGFQGLFKNKVEFPSRVTKKK